MTPRGEFSALNMCAKHLNAAESLEMFLTVKRICPSVKYIAFSDVRMDSNDITKVAQQNETF